MTDKTASVNEDAFCCNCQEDFPLADPAAPLRMGLLYELGDMPLKIRSRFHDWLDHPDGHYLCGNCYFDLTDDD